MTGLLQNVRYALRQVRKSPGCALGAVATLALGIGANTAVFSVMDADLLRTLPVRDPHRLYYLQIAAGNQPPGAWNTGNSNTSFSEPVFEALRERPRHLQRPDRLRSSWHRQGRRALRRHARGSIGVEPMVALRFE